jgi:pentatricopeptide repeat protein
MEATTDNAMELFSGVAYHLRFELAFGICALIGWLVSAAARRSGEKARSVKKSGQSNFVSEKTTASRQDSQMSTKPRDASASLIASYRRTSPDETLRMFETHRRSQTLSTHKPEVLQDIFSEVYSAAIRAGTPKFLPQYVQEAAKLGIQPTQQQLESVVKMCTAKKAFVEAIQVYDAMILKNCEGTASAWSCLLFCAVEAGQFGRCLAFYEKLRSAREPSCEDLMNMVRFVVHTKQSERLPSLLEEMRSVSPMPDNIFYNRALAVCVSAEMLDMAEQILVEMNKFDGFCDAITYNTLIKGYVRGGNVERCFALHQDMLKHCITPSEVTFGILLDACISAGMLDKAAQVFKDFQASGCKLNAVLYTTLLKGLAKAGQLDQAMKIFEQMCASEVTPDLVSYSVLIKVHCDAGKVEVALQLLDRMAQQGLAPDEIVYNNLLLGCAERKSSALGKRILEDMNEHHIRPSNVTISIMLKIHTKCKEWEAALDILETSHLKFGLPVEQRLYIQLVQSCIRERQGKRVLQVCEAMLKRCPPDEATSSKLLQQCISFNMLDSGAEILDCLLPPKGRVGAKDANALLSTALKKNKASIAKAILGSMEKGRIPVDSGNQAAAAAF